MPAVTKPLRPTNVLNVLDFGADNLGAEDSSPAIQKAINKVASIQDSLGGVVFFPPGNYLINTALDVPNNVTLQGSGWFSTWLNRTAANNNIIIDLSGTEQASWNYRQAITNLSIWGDGGTNPVVRAYYVALLHCQDVNTWNVSGDAWDLVQCWDSRWINCRWDSSSQATSQCASVRVRNSAATVGNFGYSTDTSNELRFIGCVWEAFKGHAIWCEQGTGSSTNVNGIYLTDCKMETQVARREFIYYTQNTVRMVTKNLYLALTGLDSGVSAINVVYDAGSEVAWDDVFLTTSNNSYARSLFKVDKNFTHKYRFCRQGVTATMSQGLIEVTADSPLLIIDSCLTQATPIVVVTGGTPKYLGSQVAYVAGAGKTTVSDSDWPGASGIVPNVSQILAKNTSDNTYRLFVKGESTAWKGVQLTL